MANPELLAREYVGLVADRYLLTDGQAEAADQLVSELCRADPRVANVAAAIVKGGTMPPPQYSVDDVFVSALSALGYPEAKRQHGGPQRLSA